MMFYPGKKTPSIYKWKPKSGDTKKKPGEKCRRKLLKPLPSRGMPTAIPAAPTVVCTYLLIAVPGTYYRYCLSFIRTAVRTY